MPILAISTSTQRGSVAVVEGDRLRSEVTVIEKRELGDGALLRLHVETWAARGEPESEHRVLDWRLWAWSA